PEDAARHRGTRALPRAGVVQRAAVSVTGTSARGRQLRHRAVRTDGHGRVGNAGIRGPQPGDKDEVGDVGEGTIDGATSALCSTRVREIPPAGSDARPRRCGTLSPG